jgi:hypothetical protein
VGRAIARIFAVLAVGSGVGILTWGITAAKSGQPVFIPCGLEQCVGGPSEIIGWGAGILAAGVTALLLSFVGGRYG